MEIGLQLSGHSSWAAANVMSWIYTVSCIILALKNQMRKFSLQEHRHLCCRCSPFPVFGTLVAVLIPYIGHPASVLICTVTDLEEVKTLHTRRKCRLFPIKARRKRKMVIEIPDVG